MRIVTNVEIVCSLCGSKIPIEKSVQRVPERNTFIFRAMPCQCTSQPNTSPSEENRLAYCIGCGHVHELSKCPNDSENSGEFGCQVNLKEEST